MRTLAFARVPTVDGGTVHAIVPARAATTACTPPPVASLNVSSMLPAPAVSSPTQTAPIASSPTSSSSSTCVSTLFVRHSRETLLPALEDENIRLKEKIIGLEEELKRVVDHSIESDTRLMQFTDEIFTPKPRLEVSECAPTTHRAVKCNLPDTSACTDERCSVTRDLVTRLRSTIEVLEAEVQCLRTRTDACECRAGGIGESWTAVTGRGHVVSVNNRFGRLPVCSGNDKTYNLESDQPNPRNSQKSESNLYVDLRKDLPSSAKENWNLIRPVTRVIGVCRLGAGLLVLGSVSLPPSGSCSILIAGTHDVANGRDEVIFIFLEQRIKNLLNPSSKVIVASLPHRLDCARLIRSTGEFSLSTPTSRKSARDIQTYISSILLLSRGGSLLAMACISGPVESGFWRVCCWIAFPSVIVSVLSPPRRPLSLAYENFAEAVKQFPRASVDLINELSSLNSCFTNF
ncbi:hypothetical protein J6590_049048 [Homalodisca vitripennis]|nr:hypothetical protein J6590_049048 [Homalodisca vitripennis]